MDERQLSRIEEKLDRLDRRVDHVDSTLARQEGHLEEHIRRTELAEKAIAHLRKEIEPLKAHVAKWAGAGKVLAVAGALVALFEGAVKLVEFLR
jgi:chromosome segregation ATPase